MKENQPGLSRRDFLKTLSFSAGVAGSLLLPQRVVEAQTGGYPEVITRFDTTLPLYALTIDDGWSTDALLSIKAFLNENNMKATFFLIGEAIGYCEYNSPGIIRSLVEDGHTLGYHAMESRDEQGYSDADLNWWRGDYHAYVNYLTNEVLGPELAVIGLKKYGRAPSMIFTDDLLHMYELEGLQPYGCSKTMRMLRDRGETVEKGDIVLFHATDSDFTYMQNGLLANTGSLRETSLGCLAGSEACPPVEKPDEGFFGKDTKNFR